MQERREEPWFAKVGSILLLFACFGFIAGGMLRVSREGGASAVGWMMLVVGFVLTFATVNLWGRILPGVFGLAGINALTTLWSGHLINQPNVPVPRHVALILAVLLFSAAFLSSHLAIRQFNAVHRVLLLAVFSCLLIAMSANQFAIPGAVAVVACLFVLWRLPAPHRRNNTQV